MSAPNALETQTCVVCRKPVALDDATEYRLDLHIECEPEYDALRADMDEDRRADAAMDRALFSGAL
jgi:hypothetical protein